MKLFEISIENNLDYEDYDHDSKLVVASSQYIAELRAKFWMKERYHGGYANPSFSVTEITKVDGFDVGVIL